MERYTWVRFARKLTPCHNAHSKGRHSSGAMERYTWVRFAGKLTPCQRDTWQQSAHQWGPNGMLTAGRVSWGAMGEMSQTVQNANTHILKHQSHKHARNSRSVPGPVQGRWNVTHGFDSRESSPPATDTHGHGQHTSGAMEEMSGKVQNASTHILQCQSHEHARNTL